MDYLAKEAHCAYVSDLRHLDKMHKWQLYEKVRQLPVSAASEAEWNDALSYIENLPAEASAEKARERLIAALGEPKNTTE